MEVVTPTNRAVLGRCHRCEWRYEADDSEFPSAFVFELAYQVRDGEVLIKGIEPQRVITSDTRGNPLFAHELDESEQGNIGRWFSVRLSSQSDLLIDSMSERIEVDRQSRRSATVEAFRELDRERSLEDVSGSFGRTTLIGHCQGTTT